MGRVQARAEQDIPFGALVLVRGARAVLADETLANARAVSRPPGDEREWLRGPLSRDSGYRLLVSGDMGPREIGKLIKLLEAQKAVLDDDDDD